METAWSIDPRARSSSVMTPADMEIDEAVTFQPKAEEPDCSVGAVGSFHSSEEAMPRSAITSVEAPPHFATHVPSVRFVADQNSQPKMRPSGCRWKTAKFLSPQLVAGAASGGIGTADHARIRAGSM